MGSTCMSRSMLMKVHFLGHNGISCVLVSSMGHRCEHPLWDSLHPCQNVSCIPLYFQLLQNQASGHIKAKKGTGHVFYMATPSHINESVRFQFQSTSFIPIPIRTQLGFRIPISVKKKQWSKLSITGHTKAHLHSRTFVLNNVRIMTCLRFGVESSGSLTSRQNAFVFFFKKKVFVVCGAQGKY